LDPLAYGDFSFGAKLLNRLCVISEYRISNMSLELDYSRGLQGFFYINLLNQFMIMPLPCVARPSNSGINAPTISSSIYL